MTQKAALHMIQFGESFEMGLHGCWEMSAAINGPNSNGATEWTWQLNLYRTVVRAGEKSNGKTDLTLRRFCIVLQTYYEYLPVPEQKDKHE